MNKRFDWMTPEEAARELEEGEEMSELPGNLEIVLRTEKQEWPHCMSAEVWVQKWKEHGMPEVDEGSLLCWFANAIMAGYDTASMHCSKMEES